jgi:hypothetical protein
MVLTLLLLPVPFLAMCHTPTSTAHLLSLKILPTLMMLATLLVAPRTATIAETTAPILVVEGTDLPSEKTFDMKLTMLRRHDERDYDSESDSTYRRRHRYD